MSGRGTGPAAYLGIDLGTSGLKLTAVGADGAVVAEAEAAYDVRAPFPGHAETDPALWTQAFRSALDRLLVDAGERSSTRPTFAAAGMSGQMHGVVLCGPTGEPVRPAVLWPDRRAVDVLPQWRGLPTATRGALSNPLVPGMAGPILTWLSEHEPASVAAAEVVASPKDWLRRQLTGDVATEASDGSATLLWDVVTGDWSDDALTLAGLDRTEVPRLLPSDQVVGTAGALPSDGAGAPVVTGAADTAAALVALEACDGVPSWQDAVVLNVGTGIQIVRPHVTPMPRVDPKTHLYADAAGGCYEMLAVQNGGSALEWARGAMAAGWEESVALAQRAAPGSSGAMFVPLLTGERGSVAPSGATARWSSLTTSTGRAEMLRAAFEGYAFLARRGMEIIHAPDGPVLLSGGGGRDPWVRQLLADVLDRPVAYVPLRSASAVGAAVLAARGVGQQLRVPANVVLVEPSGNSVRDALDAAYRRWVAELDRG